MSHIIGRWIQNQSIDHTKLDQTDVYTFKGVIANEGTVDNLYINQDATIRNLVVTNTQTINDLIVVNDTTQIGNAILLVMLWLMVLF